MLRHDLFDTIVAPATPVGESGIGIVRISGKDALGIADKIFTSKDNLKPSGFKTYTTHYGWIKNGAEVIDEVILTVMRSPRSYTKEDIVEINCHGGITALRRTLDIILEKGARLAEPGEFTKRAFLNGRIDLAQAEAVLDIIRAKTDSALEVGLNQLKGDLSRQINQMRKALLDTLAILEVNIDFPDEQTTPATEDDVRQRISEIDNSLKNILSGAKHGRVLREGIHVVICGKPNAGKSSLLNALLKQERSIVTAVAGTTRDTIEEIIDIKGIPVRITDTAGILEPRDLIEKKAVARSKKSIAQADLVLLLFDGSKPLSKEDQLLIKKTKGKAVIAIINKMDLKQKIQVEVIAKKCAQPIAISAKKSRNIGLLEGKIVELVYAGSVQGKEPLLVSNMRHIESLGLAQKLIAEAYVSLDNRLSLEFIAQNIKDALLCLDDILGRRVSEDLLDKIFNDFCIGK